MKVHSSITPSIGEATSFLIQAKEWSLEEVEENSSCILECSRSVLESGSAGHEEQLDCIKWLANLVESVPLYELETDVLKPLLVATGEYLDRIYDVVESANEVEKAELFTLIFILLKNLKKVVMFVKLQDKIGVGDVPTLMNHLPKILYKSFEKLKCIVQPSHGWKLEARELLILFLNVSETIPVRVIIDEELKIFKTLTSDLLAFKQVLIQLDFNLMILIWRCFIKLIIKYSDVVPVNNLRKATDVICKEVCQQVARRRLEKCSNTNQLKFMNSLDLSHKASVNEIREMMELIADVSPLPPWLTEQDRGTICQELEKMLLGRNMGTLLQSDDLYSWWEKLLNIQGDDSQHDSCLAQANERNTSGRHMADQGYPLLDADEEESIFFKLSPSFSLTPLTPSAINLLPDHMLNKTPPDLRCSHPIPGAVGSFFIFSSLSPISIPIVPKLKPVSKVKKSRNKRKMKSKAIIPSFEQKVLKSKLISAHLQKQRYANTQRFKSLMVEVNGIYKCQGCGIETGMRSKAWNHACRCGIKRKNAPKKNRLKLCKSCSKSFSSKRTLVKHFRTEHQQTKYICAQCPKPCTFKYKFSFKRHIALKHSKNGTVPFFKCVYCCYRASQKVNLNRHIGRHHKSVKIVSILLDNLVDKALATAHSLPGLCEYEKIRLDNIRERRELFETLFPRPTIPVRKPIRKKPVNKIQQQNRRSARLSADMTSSADDLSLGESSGSFEPANDRVAAVSDKQESAAESNKSEESAAVSNKSDDSFSTLFHCSLCSFKSKHRHSLKRHIKKKHEMLEENLSCPRSFCSLTFPTRWEKEQHVSRCWLTCNRELCKSKKFGRPDKYQQHLRMHKRMDEKLEE